MSARVTCKPSCGSSSIATARAYPKRWACGARTSSIRTAEPIVLFRNNDYREIKSDAGIRQVPLIGPLLAEERDALRPGWTISRSLPTTIPWLRSLPIPPTRGS